MEQSSDSQEKISTGFTLHNAIADGIRGFHRQSDPFYRTSRWLKLRGIVLAQSPFCELCAGKSNTVDHLDGDNLNNALVNLWALCANCHNWKTTVIDVGIDAEDRTDLLACALDYGFVLDTDNDTPTMRKEFIVALYNKVKANQGFNHLSNQRRKS